jgi:hypothetical protein
MRKLTQRERRVLRYHGQPASVVATAERMTINEVMEIRAALRGRGIEHSPNADADMVQLPLDYDRLMRDNRAPRRP